jgi:NAD(P)-dependent dehydrogenase (short-subunit alcohol dehydrogenase family)
MTQGEKMSKQRFTGKVAVVTGGNSGIGLAAAKAYAQEGAKVAITGRDDKTLAAAAKEIGPDTLAIRADVSKISEIEKAMAEIKGRFGKIDALFINAGIGKFLPVEQVSEAFFDETMSINLKGAFFTVQKALPLMTKGSAVVLNASINAHIGMPNTTVYGASKAALINLAKTLSGELVGRGIRVNAISPGPIQTNIITRMNLSPQEDRRARDWIQSQVPMKRIGRPEEIAAAVLHLSSDESSFTIGSELIIDGGMATL